MMTIHPRGARQAAQRLVGCILTLIGVWVARAEFTPCLESQSSPGWFLINEGDYVDAGEGLIQSPIEAIRASDGNIYYTFSSHVGTVLGRLSPTAKLELLTQSGWSNSATLVPEPIDHAMTRYEGVKLWSDPDNPAGLIGINRDGDFRAGERGYNYHGMEAFFRYSAGAVEQWTGGVMFAPLGFRSIVRSRSHDSSLAVDPQTATGVLVSTIDNGDTLGTQLTAAQLRLHDGSHLWRRWNNGDWGPNEDWPRIDDMEGRRSAFILNPNENFDTATVDKPKITHISGTQHYLMTFNANGPRLAGTGGATKACRCDVGHIPTQWQWWDGDGWTSGGDYAYHGVSGLAVAKQLFWRDHKVQVLVKNGASLDELVYDDDAESFTASSGPVVENIASTDGGYGYAVAVDSAGVLWLAYTSDQKDVVLLKKDDNGWCSGGTIANFDLRDVVPVAITFAGNDDTPIIFLVEHIAITGQYRLLALSEQTSFWSSAEAMHLEDSSADPIVLDADELRFDRTVPNDSPHGYYQDYLLADMAVDPNGYVYAPKCGNTNVVIHSPNSTQVSENYQWGDFWDLTATPGGADVDIVTKRVYFTNLNYMSGEDTNTAGSFQVWEMGLRDQFIAYRHFGESVTHIFREDYVPQEVAREFYGPADVAIDQTLGRLYLTNGLAHRVDVFDVRNLEDPILLHDFTRAGLFEYGISTERLTDVHTLISALINQDLVSDGGAIGDQGGATLSWVSQDLEEVVIPFLLNQTAFSDLGEYYGNVFLRNVRGDFKYRNNRPTFLYSFGSYGAGAGQFRFPQGIDVDHDGNVYVVDCENHRVQKWSLDSLNHAIYQESWGAAGRSASEFIFPVGLAVDDTYDRVYVTDPLNKRVQVFSKDGEFIHQFGKYYDDVLGPQQLNNIVGVATDNKGTVFLGALVKTHLPSSPDAFSLIRFRVADEFPELVVSEPANCATLHYGQNFVRGTIDDDLGVRKLKLIVRNAQGAVLTQATYDDPPASFEYGYNLPNGLTPGSVVSVEVKVIDLARNKRARFVRAHFVSAPLGDGDQDDDQVMDSCDNCPADTNPDQEDCDGDGVGDVCAIQSGLAVDCNGNGVPDSCDLTYGVSHDLNYNEIPDDCEVDCNEDGVPDSLQVELRTVPDCNVNGVPDSCDIANGLLEDCQGNGVPDDCERSLFADCDNDGVFDVCEIADGEPDCNVDGIPDSCQLAARVVATWQLPLSVRSIADVIHDRAIGDYLVSDRISGVVWSIDEHQGGVYATVVAVTSGDPSPYALRPYAIFQDWTDDSLFYVSDNGWNIVGQFIRDPNAVLPAVIEPYCETGNRVQAYFVQDESSGSLVFLSLATQFFQGGQLDQVYTLDSNCVVDLMAEIAPEGGTDSLLSSIRVAGNGDFVVADKVHSRLLRVTPQGVVTIERELSAAEHPVDLLAVSEDEYLLIGGFPQRVSLVDALGDVTPAFTSPMVSTLLRLVQSPDPDVVVVVGGSAGQTGGGQYLFFLQLDNDVNHDGVPDDCD